MRNRPWPSPVKTRILELQKGQSSMRATKLFWRQNRFLKAVSRLNWSKRWPRRKICGNKFQILSTVSSKKKMSENRLIQAKKGRWICSNTKMANSYFCRKIINFKIRKPSKTNKRSKKCTSCCLWANQDWIMKSLKNRRGTKNWKL